MDRSSLSMGLDFSKWAMLSPKNATGLGRMAEDATRVLGIHCHLVSDTFHLQNKSFESSLNEIPLPASLSKKQLRSLLQSIPHLQAILTFERLTWHPDLTVLCQELGIPIFCVVMWEWFTGKDPIWKRATALICPSDFTTAIVASYGYKHYLSLPWVLDLSKFPPRKVQGPARYFGHNAGVIDLQDRKGTLDVIQAFSKLKDPHSRLRIQYVHSELPLPAVDERIKIIQGPLEAPASLFEGIDAAIQPSKMEGIGFMVLEAVCSGIPTITLDYPPMNTYERHPSLLVKKSFFKRRALSTSLCEHAHLYLPKPKSLLEQIRWCTKNDLSLISTQNRLWAESYFNPAQLKNLWYEKLKSYF